jgi:hypothetical protein
MSTKPLGKAIDPTWWASLTPADQVALLQAFRYRTGIDLSERGGSPADLWRGYEERQHSWRQRRMARRA